MIVAADKLPPTLTGWATQIAGRFGRPVYLVGSALLLPEPRDFDVRCVISDDEWEPRYGHHSNYERGCWLPQFVPEMRRYFEDMAKLNREGTLAVRLNLDFQVHPYRFAEQYAKKSRKRLDMLADLPALFEEVPA